MKLIKYKLDDFSGGFSAEKDENAMGCSFTPNSYNVESLRGSLKTMTGTAKYIDSDIIYNEKKYFPMQFMIKYSLYSNEFTSANDKLMFVATNIGQTAIFEYNNGWKRIGGNVLEGSLDCINYYFNGDNQLIFCNSSVGIYLYDEGTNKFNLIENSPEVKAITLQGERIWGIGTNDEPNMVYYSEEGNPNGWNMEDGDAGSLSVTTADGDYFVGIDNVFDDIVLYRCNSLFRITGTSPLTYQIKQIPAASGAVNINAIANNARYSFYIGYDGIYRYDGIKASMVENGRLKLFFDNYVNKNNLRFACAVINDNKLYAAVPVGDSQYSNTVIEYDILSGVFNIRKGVDILNMVVFQNKIIYLDSSRNICIFDGGSDYNGFEIQAHYETPFYDFDNKNAIKTLDSIYFMAKGNGSVKISAETENGINTATVELKSSQNMDLYKIMIHNYGRRYKFAFDNIDGSVFELASPEFNLEIDDDD